MGNIHEHMLLLGDVNGHHKTWGSRLSIPWSSILASATSKHGLTILNDGESVIVITLACSQICEKLTWEADPDLLHGSDHRPIMVALAGSPIPGPSRRPTWKFDQPNWSSF